MFICDAQQHSTEFYNCLTRNNHSVDTLLVTLLLTNFVSVLESPFNVTTMVVVAMAIFCAVCLAVIVYMKVKFVPKQPQPDPDRETYL